MAQLWVARGQSAHDAGLLRGPRVSVTQASRARGPGQVPGRPLCPRWPPCVGGSFGRCLRLSVADHVRGFSFVVVLCPAKSPQMRIHGDGPHSRGRSAGLSQASAHNVFVGRSAHDPWDVAFWVKLPCFGDVELVPRWGSSRTFRTRPTPASCPLLVRTLRALRTDRTLCPSARPAVSETGASGEATRQRCPNQMQRTGGSRDGNDRLTVVGARSPSSGARFS